MRRHTGEPGTARRSPLSEVRLLSPVAPELSGPRASWRGLVILAFVFVTLVALVALPALVQEGVDVLRDEIEASEPARTLVAQVQFAAVREATALDELLVTGGAAGTTTYDTAYATESAAIAKLGPAAARLGPEARARFATLHAALARWHARTEPGPLAPRGGYGGHGDPEAARLLEEVIRAAAAVDSAILDANDETRRRIGVMEKAGLTVTVVLGLLALLAAAAVAALHARVGRFAAEADARRAEAEGALAAASRATEARARLLRGVTHDVKNPLGAAKGYADLLVLGVEGALTPGQASLVGGIKRTIDRALAIITDLLDVSRADAGRLTIQPVPADLVRVAAAAAEDHRAAAEAAGLALTFAPAVDALPLCTDPARVRQVLDNLLSNAVKYTPAPGRVAVHVEPVALGDAAAPGLGATVRVVDSGPGIPPDRRDAIFDEFSRLHEGSGPAGHGLGLAIARRIARLLGGELSVADGAGAGATFVLRLPTDGPRAPAA